MSEIKKDKDYAKKAFNIVHKVSKILYQLESKHLVFGQISLNNIFISKDGTITLGVPKIAMVCLEYYYSKVTAYDDSIYLPPEFIKNYELSTQTDIYSFGIVAYYIYIKQWPYEQTQSIDKLKILFQDGPKLPKEFNENISNKLNYFILKCIQLTKEERWGSFRFILNILEGKQSIQFDNLSNKFMDENMFQSEIQQYKKNKIGKVLNRVFIPIAILLLGALLYFVYSSYYLKYEVVQVPSVENLLLDDAVNQLKDLKLSPTISQYNYHPTIEEGAVIRIEPIAGRSIKQGRKVRLFVSKGRQEILVPSLIGKHWRI